VVALPKAFPYLYGFALADLDGDGASETLILDRQDYLRVFDRSGTEIYRSSDHYGRTELILTYDPSRAGPNPRSGIEPNQIFLQGRMFHQDIMGNGKKQLVLPRNTPSTGYMFQTRLYDKGKVFGLSWTAWDAARLGDAGRPGYITDYALMDPTALGTANWSSWLSRLTSSACPRAGRASSS
jgi:hypothetical protein